MRALSAVVAAPDLNLPPRHVQHPVHRLGHGHALVVVLAELEQVHFLHELSSAPMCA